MEKTHNLEVIGSSPIWSTKGNQQGREFSGLLIFFLQTICEHHDIHQHT